MEIHSINGIQTCAFSSRIELMDYACASGKSLIALNALKIQSANEEMKCFINENIGYADGMGAVWALRKKCTSKVVKIPGCELWLDIIRRYQQHKSFYIVGGTEQTMIKVRAKLKCEFPELNLKGCRNGYIKSDAEQQSVIEDIKRQEPDFVFVAMGSPQQEDFMIKAKMQHGAIYQGLGGSLDVYVGTVKRAPELWIKLDLECVYRCLRQPKRLFPQLKCIPYLMKILFN